MIVKSKSWASGQHDLICKVLGVSPSPTAPCATAYEGVCVLVAMLARHGVTLAEIRAEVAKDEAVVLVM